MMGTLVVKGLTRLGTQSSIVSTTLCKLFRNSNGINMTVVTISNNYYVVDVFVLLHPAITCSKLTIEELDQGMKYIHS